MMRASGVALGLLAISLGAGAARDVPKGHCHNCEVSCFEDCNMKFDREIVQPDLTGKDRLSRKDSRVEAHMKKKMHGVVLEQTSSLKESYSTCLVKDDCPCPIDDAAKPSFLAATGAKKKCAVRERSCAVGCVNKTLDEALPALVQVKPGPRDPDDSAIPWSVNIHPVKINTFATGRQNLERCFKSCLAATCGCDDAPGMEAIDDLGNAIKANDMAKDPVEDSHPSWQYKHATIADCGKGMPGKKITTGLYTGHGDHWNEVCSDGFFEAMGAAAAPGKKNCGNGKALLAGCVWDDQKGKCVYGLKKMMECNVRYQDDDKF